MHNWGDPFKESSSLCSKEIKTSKTNKMVTKMVEVGKVVEWFGGA
jgi:hypothetical protein